ncbi:MAG: DinB family protein [Bacteroidota bacterium]|nr:DinB family protein [Bacteroidota bacterium]
MHTEKLPEAWLRGPVAGIPALLQPVAHALIQSREEIRNYTRDFPGNLLWDRPAGRASVAFHLQHICGVIDRMLTYAEEKPLTEEQFSYLKKEGVMQETISLDTLVENAENKIDEMLRILPEIPSESLIEFRGVGRKQLPSTVLGLLFHAAEHTQRHIGQMLVSISVVKEQA